MGYFNKFKRVLYDISGDNNKQVLVNLTSSVKLSDKLIDNVSFYNYVHVSDGERMEQLSHRIYGSTEYYWTFLLVNKNIKNIWNDWPKSLNQILEYCSKKYGGVAGLVNDGSLNSTTFDIGEIVYTTNTTSTRAKVKSIHANNGFVVLEPLYWCENGSGDSKSACELGGGTWKESNLKTDTSQSIISETDASKSISTTGIVDHMHAPHHHIEDSTGNIIPVSTSGTSPVSFFQFEEVLNDNNRKIKIIKPEYINDIVREFETEIGK